MSPQDFLAHFHEIANAPGGVVRLRELILTLAVQGKVVDQNPSEESGSHLLKQIASTLSPEQIKKIGPPLPTLTPDEFPFDVPKGWTWARFQQIAVISSNLVSPSGFQEFIHLAPDNIVKGAGLLLPCATVREDKVKSANHRFFPGQIVYSKIRPNLSKAVLVDFEGLCSADMYPIDALIYPPFLLRFMLSGVFLAQAVKTDTRVAMPKINQSELNAISVPVPPLAEQKRIVAKVEELMALCDALESQQQERARLLPRLSRATHTRLTDSPTQPHLDSLFTDLASVSPEDMRRTILSLAVNGHLVDTASQIEPETVGDHVDFLNGYAFKSEWFKTSGIKLCRNVNVNHGILDWREAAHVSSEIAEELERYALQKGDIVLSLDRPIITTGLKVARIRTEDLPCLLLQRVAKPVPKTDKLELDYFYLWLQSPAFIDSIDPGRSNGVPHISTKQVQKLKLRLPPPDEQRRIVAKVDELMALVDTLEAQQQNRGNLAEAFAKACTSSVTAS